MNRVATLSIVLAATLAGQSNPTVSGSFSLIAGDGLIGYSPDGTPAMNAALNSPTAVALTPSGGIIFADRLNYLLRTITSSGRRRPIARWRVRHGAVVTNSVRTQVRVSPTKDLLWNSGCDSVHFAV